MLAGGDGAAPRAAWSVLPRGRMAAGFGRQQGRTAGRILGGQDTRPCGPGRRPRPLARKAAPAHRMGHAMSRAGLLAMLLPGWAAVNQDEQ